MKCGTIIKGQPIDFSQPPKEFDNPAPEQHTVIVGGRSCGRTETTKKLAGEICTLGGIGYTDALEKLGVILKGPIGPIFDPLGPVIYTRTAAPGYAVAANSG